MENNNNVIYKYVKIDTNEVVYIGRTNNFLRRRREHEVYEPQEKGRPQYDYPLSRGIRKYGVDNYKCEIIEEGLTYEESLKREIYWIEYYDTYNDPSKYNYTPGGECVTESKYDDELVNEVKLLLEEKVDFKTIQEKTGISISHISEINTGKRRKDSYHTYPINNMTCGRKLTIEQVMEIIELLKTTKIPNQQIGAQYNVDEGTIQNINLGKRYYQKDIQYPIREKCKVSKNHKLNEEEFENLVADIQNTNVSFAKLALKYNISSSTVYNINKGVSRKSEKYSYPLRK